MKFYVAASMTDADKARRLAADLQARGHGCTFRWFDLDHAEVWSSERRARVADQELNGVAVADVLILLAPGGRGAHVELGVALTMSRRVLILGPARFSLFYCHPLVKHLPDWAGDFDAVALELSA